MLQNKNAVVFSSPFFAGEKEKGIRTPKKLTSPVAYGSQELGCTGQKLGYCRLSGGQRVLRHFLSVQAPILSVADSDSEIILVIFTVLFHLVFFLSFFLRWV